MNLPASLKFAAALALAGLLLAGCERKSANPMPPPQGQTESLLADKMPPGMGGGTAGVTRAEGRHTEIVYSFSLLVPAQDATLLLEKHLAECRRLGCEVLSTSLDRSFKDAISAHASVRIAPEAFPAFEQIVSAPPAEVDHRSETATDQTLPLLDAEKRLEIKALLRDRLTAMLREPGQKSAADIAAIERQIAEVQGEIESGTAQRDYLRKITQTVRVDIAYLSASARGNGIDFSPVADALKGANRTFIRSLGDLISVTIWLVPWVPFAALAYWIARRVQRRGKTQ
jgi:Domain of unknown function (DUF4349)